MLSRSVLVAVIIQNPTGITNNELGSLFMNTARKLGPHTQTGRGTCPGRDALS
jgi:hypothetical protein